MPVSRPLADLRILVAEDNKVNQLVIQGMIKSFGCAPILVENGALAVAACEADQVDMIFMDIQMPVMDGIEATCAIRTLEKQLEWTRRIPIIAITANAMDGDREKYLAADMDDYLSKPLVMEDFSSLLKKWAVKLSHNMDLKV